VPSAAVVVPPPAVPSASVVLPPPDIQKHIGSLLLSNEGADVTFQVGAETVVAHRCVLAARSAVSRAELFGPMKEGTTASVIQVHDMEPQVFKLLLGFIYTDLVVAADRYDLRRLGLMSEKKLRGFIKTNTVVPILALAEQHRRGGLKAACLGFLNSPENLQVVMKNGGLEDLTRTCPAVLKELIAKLASLKFDDANTRDDTGVAALPFVAPPSDIQQDLATLLRSGEGTDVTFQVGNEVFAAHRSVLAARSRVFRDQLFSSSAEGTTSSDVIRIEDTEPKVFRLLLGFSYSDQIPEIEEDDGMDVTWQLLLMAADRYELHRLKLLCEEELCGYIDVSTVPTILALAEELHSLGLKEACLDFLRLPY
jgi:speckle-type POZ protein